MKLNRFLALAALLTAALMFNVLGLTALPVVAALFFVVAAIVAGPSARTRGGLGVAPDTTDVAAGLNLNEILDSSLEAFKRAVMPLTLFSTLFRNVPLKGTDVVEVPYYPLQGIASQNFNYGAGGPASGPQLPNAPAIGYNFNNGSGSKTDARPIAITTRKYQPLLFTGHDLARLPMLNAQKLGQLKGEALAYDVLRDIFSIITPANFPGLGYSGPASAFDSDSVVGLRVACSVTSEGPNVVTDAVTTNGSLVVTSATANFSFSDNGVPISGAGIPAGAYIDGVTNATTITLSTAATATANGVTLTMARPLTPWPETGRSLIVNPTYDGALLQDNVFSQAYSIGTTQAIQEGRLPRVFGFDYASSAAIPTNNVNLQGFAAYQSAVLVAFSPIEPPPAARAVMTQYEVLTDPDTGISIEFRAWGDPNTDAEKRVIECNYGYALGEALAIKRIVSQGN